MDKKIYNKPEMAIILLKHRASLLAESDPGAQGEDGGEVGGARQFVFDGKEEFE